MSDAAINDPVSERTNGDIDPDGHPPTEPAVVDQLRDGDAVMVDVPVYSAPTVGAEAPVNSTRVSLRRKNNTVSYSAMFSIEDDDEAEAEFTAPAPKKAKSVKLKPGPKKKAVRGKPASAKSAKSKAKSKSKRRDSADEAVTAPNARGQPRKNYRELGSDDEFEAILDADAEFDEEALAQHVIGDNDDYAVDEDDLDASAAVKSARVKLSLGGIGADGAIPDWWWGNQGWIGRSQVEAVLARRTLPIDDLPLFEVTGLDAVESSQTESAPQPESATEVAPTGDADGDQSMPPLESETGALVTRAPTNSAPAMIEQPFTTATSSSIPQSNYWYLVKLRGRSHLHCRWLPEPHFLQFLDGKTRIVNFTKRATQHQLEEIDLAEIASRTQSQSQSSESSISEPSRAADYDAGTDIQPGVVWSKPSEESKETDAHSNHDVKTIAESATAKTETGAEQLSGVKPVTTSDTETDTTMTDVTAESNSEILSLSKQSADELHVSSKSQEEADLAAFMAREEERKQARIAAIQKEQEEARRLRALAPLMDSEVLNIDRIVDHRAKPSKGKLRSRQSRVEAQIEEYQRDAHRRAMQFFHSIRQQYPVRTASSLTLSQSAIGPQSLPPIIDDLVADSDSNIEVLVKWTRVGYDDCTWELAKSLLAAHSGAKFLSNPLIVNGIDPPPYSEPLTKYITLIDPNTTNIASIVPSQTLPKADAIVKEPKRKKRKVSNNGGSNDSNGNGRGRRSSRTSIDYAKVNSGKSQDSTDDDDDDSEDETTDVDEVVTATDANTGTAAPTETNGNTGSLSAIKSLPVTSAMRFGSSQLQLRPYQVDGVNWIVLNWLVRRNGILADEMGLGKSFQSLASCDFMLTKHSKPLVHPVLIVAPLSTLDFWKREIERATELYAVVYTGTVQARQLIRKHEFEWSQDTEINYKQLLKMIGKDNEKINLNNSSYSKPRRRDYKANVVITSYTYICNDFAALSKLRWSILVIDESQRIKSIESLTYRQLLQFRPQHKLLLTGTPIQNNMQELFALLHFVDPKEFNSMQTFLAMTKGLHSAEDWTNFANSIRPYLLRRWKSEVEKSLPPKEEMIVTVELTLTQKKWYRALYEKNLRQLTSMKNKQSLINISMQLRKCCHHPWLLEGVEAEETKDITNSRTNYDRDAVMERLVSASGKFVLLEKLLPKLKSEGHRVLIFSQMTKLLTIIEDYLVYRGYEYCRLDGNVKGQERQEQIQRYNAHDSSVFCFLLSTRAGGLGITLTSADTVILFDSDWNLQNDLQAIDRAHRIGQTKHVMVYRLLTARTYEHEMFAKSCSKLTLEKLVMSSIGGEAVAHSVASTSKDKSGVPYNKEELEELIKKGAYDVFADSEGDQKSLQFCDEDIDAILKRAQIVRYETSDGKDDTKSGASAMSSQGAFSKATFRINGEQEIALDDPEFWQKLGLQQSEAPAPDNGEGLITYEDLGERRARSQRVLYNEDILARRQMIEEAQPSLTTTISTKKLPAPKKEKVKDKFVVETGRCMGCHGITNGATGEPILVCDKCTSEYHIHCANPEAMPTPEQPFLCPRCFDKRIKKLESQRRRRREISEKKAEARRQEQINSNPGVAPPPADIDSTEARARYYQLIAFFKNSHPDATDAIILNTAIEVVRKEMREAAARLPTPLGAARATTSPAPGGAPAPITSVSPSPVPPAPVHSASAANVISNPGLAMQVSRPMPAALPAPSGSHIHQPATLQQVVRSPQPQPTFQFSQPQPPQNQTQTLPADSTPAVAAAGAAPTIVTALSRGANDIAYQMSWEFHAATTGGSARRCSGPGCDNIEPPQPQPGDPRLFSICGRCLLAAYCSRECQAKHWKGGHKLECSKIKAAMEQNHARGDAAAQPAL